MTWPMVLIVGAGFAGFHCARELDRLRQRGIDVRLGTGISEITESAVRLTDGAELPCHTVVWTAGVMASPLIGTLGLETVRSGRLWVTPELQVPGRPEVFSAGDDFTRLVLPDPMSGTLADQEATGPYLSAGDTRQTAERILAHDQAEWPT